MRRFVFILAALIVAPEADAKLCANVTVLPTRPAPGQRTEVTLTTWKPHWVGARPQFGGYSALPASSALHVDVAGPHAAPFTVALRRDPARPWVWRGRMSFRSSGLWLLSPDRRRWASAPRTCAPVLRVNVAAPGASLAL